MTWARAMDPAELLADTWAERFAARCGADPELRAIAGQSEFSFRWQVGHRRRTITVSRGTVRVTGHGAPGQAGSQPWSFSICGPAEVWRDWLQPVPPPGHHDVMALWVTGQVSVTGEQKSFAQNLPVVRRLLELGRAAALGEDGPGGPELGAAAAPAAAAPVELERISGRYVSLAVLGTRCRVYFEEAGHGPAVLFLHTAGADARQYHSFLTDPEFAPYRLIACDLPYHGRSFPPEGWWQAPYRLTQEFYASFVEAFCAALGLDRPILVGASMGAQIVLELSLRRPGGYAAVVAFGPADYVGREPAPWLHHPEVNETETVPAWVVGMTGPQTTQARRQEIRWVYSQGGPGVFAGDGHFFLTEWDIRDRLDRLDTASCPVYLFAGEYDYSRPPDSVRRIAESIPGAAFVELPGCGHFPMVESPEQVKPHLLAILAGASLRTRG